jgi:hypothetical protein
VTLKQRGRQKRGWQVGGWHTWLIDEPGTFAVFVPWRNLNTALRSK